MRSSRPHILNNFLTVLTFLVVSINAFGQTELQKARDIFLDGKLPRTLDKVSNQGWQLSNSELVQKIMQRDAGGNRLTVAIIDGGADITHPDLINQMAFKVQNGKIVESGYDFMAEDKFGSANLINAQYYAFGGEIQSGKIAKYVDHPLDLIEKYNTDFMDAFIKNIQAHPKLAKTPFAKVTHDSMSLYGALVFLNVIYPQLKMNDLQQFADSLQKDVIKQDYIAGRPWAMSRETGLPRFDNGDMALGLEFMVIEAGKEFFEVMNKTLKEFPGAENFKKALQSFVQFKAISYAGRGLQSGDLFQISLREISNALYFKKYGTGGIDNIKKLNDQLEAVYNSYAKIQKQKDPKAQTAAPKDILMASMQNYAGFLSNIAQNASSVDVRVRAIKTLEEFMSFQLLLDWFREKTQWNPDQAFIDPVQNVNRSERRKLVVRSFHPHYSTQSYNETHASHVAGITQIQNPLINTASLRVGLGDFLRNSVEVQKEKKIFQADFLNWLTHPAVFQAVGAHAKNFISDVNFSDLSEANRKEGAAKIMKFYTTEVTSLFQGGSGMYTQTQEIIEAIKYVGREKIALANLSLGGTSDRPTSPWNGEIALDKPSGLFRMMFLEHYKFRVGETIAKFAPNSIFVFAAGNDGSWIDGFSKSTTPVVLHSSFLEKFESADAVVPNNHLKNVVAVASMGPDKSLSSFSNIPLNKMPLVVAEGESILSAIKTTDLSGAMQLFKRHFPTLMGLGFTAGVAQQNSELHKRLKNKYLFGLSEKVGLTGDDNPFVETEIDYLTKVEALMQRLVQSVIVETFLEYPQHRARLSGTSMATPLVTGSISDFYIQKAKRLNVPLSQTYDHPEFTAEKIIQEFTATLEVDANSNLIINFKRLTKSKQFESSAAEKEAEALFTNIKAEAKKLTTEAAARAAQEKAMANAKLNPMAAAVRKTFPGIDKKSVITLRKAAPMCRQLF